MKKIYDNLFFTRLSIKFVSDDNLKNLMKDSDYQFIEIINKHEWKKEHILFANQIQPIHFKEEYRQKIAKEKKIIIFGEWRRNVRYYRFLKYHNYDVYLIKHKNWNEIKKIFD